MSGLILFQVAEMYRDALATLEDSDLPAEAIADTLQGLTGDLQQKAIAVASFAANLDALADKIKEAEEAMAHRRKVLTNKAESIREYIKQCMETAGVQKISCEYFEIAVVKNPPSAEITDEAAISDVYKRVPPPPPAVLDKKLILEALKGGASIDGAQLVQKTRLRIK